MLIKPTSQSIRILPAALAIATVLSLTPVTVLADEWSLGVNLLAGNSPYMGDDEAAALLPVLAYKGERFHANLGNPGISYFNGIMDFAGLGYSVIKAESYHIDLLGKLRMIGFDPDEDDELRGLDERKPGFDVGISTGWDSGFGELNAQLLTDISNRSDGWEAVLSYAYPLKQGAWTLRPEIGLSWQSGKLADYYFGVDSNEVNASRPAYEAESTLTPFAGIQAEYAFSQSTHLVGGVGISRLGDGIGDSPIVDERNVGGGYAGLVYRF